MAEEEAIALGWFYEQEESEEEEQKKCPKCGSKLVLSVKKGNVKIFKCKQCRYIWEKS